MQSLLRRIDHMLSSAIDQSESSESSEEGEEFNGEILEITTAKNMSKANIAVLYDMKRQINKMCEDMLLPGVLHLNEKITIPELVRQISLKGFQLTPTNVSIFIGDLRPNTTELSPINWHSDPDYIECKRSIKRIMPLLFTKREKTAIDEYATVHALSSERADLLSMHGLAGDCKNMDGDYYWQPFSEFRWGKVDFCTAEFGSRRVSLMKGRIHFIEHQPGGGREYFPSHVTRYSVCPLDESMNRVVRAQYNVSNFMIPVYNALRGEFKIEFTTETSNTMTRKIHFQDKIIEAIYNDNPQEPMYHLRKYMKQTNDVQDDSGWTEVRRTRKKAPSDELVGEFQAFHPRQAVDWIIKTGLQ